MSPEMSPFVPSVEADSLELLSENTIPTKAEAIEVESAIFEQDAILPIKKHGDSRYSHRFIDNVFCLIARKLSSVGFNAFRCGKSR